MNYILSIKTHPVILILALMPILCCHEPRVRDDDIYSDIEIIGKEKCFQNPDMNAWVINLESPNEKDKVGIEILIDGVVYKNVVKTKYNLSEVFSDTLRKYTVRCSPKVVLGNACNISEESITPIGTENIPIIEVLSVGFSGSLIK